MLLKVYPSFCPIQIQFYSSFKFFICILRVLLYNWQMIVPEFYEQMSQTYPSIHYWPQPYSYMLWYGSLDA